MNTNNNVNTLQLINKDGAFDEHSCEQFINEHNGNEWNRDYNLISIMGPQVCPFFQTWRRLCRAMFFLSRASEEMSSGILVV
jgi:hypothetical protein